MLHVLSNAFGNGRGEGKLSELGPQAPTFQRARGVFDPWLWPRLRPHSITPPRPHHCPTSSCPCFTPAPPLPPYPTSSHPVPPPPLSAPHPRSFPFPPSLLHAAKQLFMAGRRRRKGGGGIEALGPLGGGKLAQLALTSCNLFDSSADRVTVHFINRDGERLTATAKEGESLLEVVVNQNLSIDGFGACEGTLACSTCHLIFEEDVFQKLDAITDEELDMLDLAYGLTDTSRLGCQVCVKKAMDGLTVQVPAEVADMRRELEVGKQSK
uniref:2Fe-2S ferredoxin-type domain-containing protein n=1 Tax=Gopherus agassizii TaxID=38772 RepID=A0A452HGL2_9SAUR